MERTVFSVEGCPLNKPLNSNCLMNADANCLKPSWANQTASLRRRRGISGKFSNSSQEPFFMIRVNYFVLMECLLSPRKEFMSCRFVSGFVCP